MGRAPCCDKDGLKKGPWTPEEDLQLTQYIQMHGPGNWRALPKKAGLKRCGKSCRLRWTNYLRPDIKRGRFSFEEEETIIQLHSIMGNKWSAIAARLPGRTDNEIKNYWNTHIRKRLLRMGLDPVTHSPRLDLLDLSTILNSTLFSPSQLNLSNLLGMQQQQQQQLVPDFLRLASTLMSLKQEQNQLGFLQSLQENQTSNTPSQQTLIPPLQSNQFQTPTTFVDQAQFMQANFNGFTSNMTNFSCPSSTENLAPSNETNYGFVDHDQMISKLDTSFQPLNMSQNNQNNFTFDSVLSTPSSSANNALNSTSTTYVNSNTYDDVRDSYCSNMLNFEFLGSLDISDFL